MPLPSKRSVVLGALGVVVLLLAIASGLVRRESLAFAKRAPGTKAECGKDGDCALVPNDCCSCNEGGAQHAIPTKQRDAYEALRHKRCVGMMCAQMLSQHPTCSQRAACRAGACELR